MKIRSLLKWQLLAAIGITLLASVGYAAYPAAAP